MDEQEAAVEVREEEQDAQGEQQETGAESAEGSQNPDFAMIQVEEPQENDEDAEKPAAQKPTAADVQRLQQLQAQRAANLSARIDGDIAAAGVPNPYTGQPFRSVREFQEYGAKLRDAEIRKQAKSTGRSVEELTEEAADRAFVRTQRQQAERAQLAAEQRQAQQAFFDRDYQDFTAKYPNVDPAVLEKDKLFMRFAGSRYGHEPLAKLYGDYKSIVGDVGAAEAVRKSKKADRSTGGGRAGGVSLSPDQKKLLDEWNADHPEMAMTAKEFMSRG